MSDYFDVEGRLPNVIALMLLDSQIDADAMQPTRKVTHPTH